MIAAELPWPQGSLTSGPPPRLPLFEEEKERCLGKQFIYSAKLNPKHCPRHSPDLGGEEGLPGTGGERGGGGECVDWFQDQVHRLHGILTNASL